MTREIALQCRCGRVQGRLLTPTCLHARCWCDCCKRFAAWMESQSPGCTAGSVDASGGTEVFQYFCDQVRLDTGMAFVRQTRLKHTTLTARYISTCCYTPLFATLIRPFFVPIVDVYAGFILDKASHPAGNRPAEYAVFALQAANVKAGEAVRNGWHYRFILRSLLRILQGVALLKFRPAPVPRSATPAPLIIADANQ